jgi:7-carboxy-7-deazaguanine synthase
LAYVVKDSFLTLQGEGARCGTVAVFCRFVGCNLWSGLDTDFLKPYGAGGGKFETAEALADHLVSLWMGSGTANRAVVFTGGEPLLQLDEALIKACQSRGFHVAVETNGTIAAPLGLDWICVSPKAGVPLAQTSGHELKLVFPQDNLSPDKVDSLAFDHFLLQPMDGSHRTENTRLAVSYCQRNPKWRLSVQTHKWIGIP